MSKSKSVTELLSELDASPPAPASESERLKALSREDKKAKAYELKMYGMSGAAIARVFDVNRQTVYTWFAELTSEYRSRFEQEPAANVVAEHFSTLDRYEEMCLFEARQLGPQAEYDEATGTIKQTKKQKGWHLKLQFLRLGLQARREKIQLGMDVGLIPKDPTRIYHSLEQEGKASDSASGVKERSPEEIRNDLMNLLGKSVTL